MLSDGGTGRESPNLAQGGLTGQLIGGRYEIGERIGQGGMSTVYRARDRSLGRAVAVKVIRYPLDPDSPWDHLRERFRREAANAARIPPHPNIVQTFDYGTDPVLDVDFIVMELVQGRDLKTALGQGAFNIGDSVRILLGAARGLAAGHRVGIIHRDVKPANVFLAGESQFESVRVLDFGIAKALEADPDDDLTRLTGIPHTPAYASPEQWGSNLRLTAASDVYQLGLVAYELLAGERAFDARARERMQAGEAIPLPARGRWDQVPSALRAVVERSLRQDPQARYPNAAAFAEALSAGHEEDRTLFAGARLPAGSDSTAVQTPKADVPAPPHRPFSPRPWVVLGAAVVIILLLAILRSREDPVGGFGNVPSALEFESEFAPLYQEAAERLNQERSAPTEG